MSYHCEIWPTSAGLLSPAESLWHRLVCRISAGTGASPLPAPMRQWSEPEWEEVAPGISRKWLEVDVKNERLSLLVQFAPAAHYAPCAQHAIEELYVLHGDLWIKGRKLCPGEYKRPEASDAHPHVWSEMGCTCVIIAVFSHVALRRSDLRGHRAKPSCTP